MAKEYSVYKHTAPNGKIYIGMSSNPVMRWNNGEGYRDNEGFYADIKQYGWKNISHEIVVSGLSREDALRIESILISQFKSCDSDKGYNRTSQNRETRSKRAQIVVRPSVYEIMNKIATMRRMSFNGLVNDIFEEYLSENEDLVEKYEKLFGVD